MRRILPIGALLIAGVAAACTVHQVDTPPLAGPSEFALSLQLTATPDSIVQNGVDTTQLRVIARDANGRPVSNLGFNLQVTNNGNAVDWGALSSRTIYTGADGTASATYTAPAAPPQGAPPSVGCHGLAGPCITIVANPIGTNYLNSYYNVWTVDVRLAPPPPAPVDPNAPIAAFGVSDSAPAVRTDVTFDGRASRPSTGRSIISWSWDFGDGVAKTGSVVVHDFDPAGTYYVKLTVTDNLGTSSTITQAITVH